MNAPLPGVSSEQPMCQGSRVSNRGPEPGSRGEHRSIRDAPITRMSRPLRVPTNHVDRTNSSRAWHENCPIRPRREEESMTRSGRGQPRESVMGGFAVSREQLMSSSGPTPRGAYRWECQLKDPLPGSSTGLGQARGDVVEPRWCDQIEGRDPVERRPGRRISKPKVG